MPAGFQPKKSMPLDITKFSQTLPYASELFGIYQPLVGWRSKRIINRINTGFQAYLDPAVRAVIAKMHPAVDVVQLNDPREFRLNSLGIASPNTPEIARANSGIDTLAPLGPSSRPVLPPNHSPNSIRLPYVYRLSGSGDSRTLTSFPQNG